MTTLIWSCQTVLVDSGPMQILKDSYMATHLHNMGVMINS